MSIILITQKDHQRRAACLQKNQIIDIDWEDISSLTSTQGDTPRLDQIYWGRVIGPLAGQSSPHVFVQLTPKHIGLLPLESGFSHPLEGEAILVQVRREAIPDKGTPSKGPTLTRKIVLGGRFCLYHPSYKKFTISAKVQDLAVRTRLQSLFSPLEPLTLREAAATASETEIFTEITQLRDRFSSLKISSRSVPQCTPYDALPSSHRWMRNRINIEQILVDHDDALSDVRAYLKQNRPDLLALTQKYTKTPQGSLFEAYDLEDTWDSLFLDVVPLPHGANIVIDQTAAAVVIDVNQGQKTHLETNKDAIPLIIQHLKWRHLGGNIIIDFVGLQTDPKERAILNKLLQEQATQYQLPLQIYGWSKLGWLEARLPKQRAPLYASVST